MTEVLWKTREQVKRITISSRVLGSGAFGQVYHGRIWFKGAKPKRVAVKLFRPHTAKHLFERSEIDDEVVRHYEEAIARLHRAGVNVPKTGFVKHKGQWVQVQDLFSRQGASKIRDIRLLEPEIPEIVNNERERSALFDLVGKIVNAGFIPHPDTIAAVQTRNGRRFFVQDLDFLAHVNFLQTLTRMHPSDLRNALVNRLNVFIIKMQSGGMNRQEAISELKKRITNPQALRALRNIKWGLILDY
ncbi:hypothetical protein HY571_00770 [Candidatus Micrarchaeota archaeon]|nr:hypothetical protein [Candidatus Micrarchaeota archaeon]